MPKISVIIPVFNDEKYIKKCIDSVLNQSFKDFEIIVINDGSTDNTKTIIKEKFSEIKKVRITNQKNLGPALTRNKGIKLSLGKYIMFIDGDDYVEKDYLKSYYDLIKNDNYDIVIGGYKKIVNNKITNIVKLRPGDFSKYLVTGPVCRIINKDFIIKNNIDFLNTNSSEDVYFNLLIYNRTNKIGINTNTSYNYIYNCNSLSNTAHKGFKKEIKIIELLNKINFKNGYNLEMNQYFIIKYCIWYLLYSGKTATKSEFLSEYDLLFGWLNNNIDKYWKNKYISFIFPKEEPFKHKIIIKSFIIISRINLVKLFAKIYCKGSKK